MYGHASRQGYGNIEQPAQPIFITLVLLPIYFVYSLVSIYRTFTRFIGQGPTWLAVSTPVYLDQCIVYCVKYCQNTNTGPSIYWQMAKLISANIVSHRQPFSLWQSRKGLGDVCWGNHPVLSRDIWWFNWRWLDKYGTIQTAKGTCRLELKTSRSKLSIIIGKDVFASEFLTGFEAWAKLVQQWLVCAQLGIHLEPINKELVLLVTIWSKLTVPLAQRENCAVPYKKLFGPMVCHMRFASFTTRLWK